uniref:E3 ubiquitin-protein ligase listerin n=1 Tax=Lygus hesperus TaxID=30085 RepID=A0A146M5V2_LYGHE
MGGKKQAQRTKNNAKPSSSGRTAELLSSNSAQFSGFSSLKGTHFPSSTPSAITLDVFDSQLDPNVVVVLKKLSKKDATTRFKALNELVALVNECQDDAGVVHILPYWVKLYTNLVVDVENKVREATQSAHRAIAVRVGRNLAPHIKQIVPSWFISQCDTHPPAASVAALAFKEAFPPRKIVDVIVFCQSEIIKYISDNLLTEKNIPKNDEETEAKFERIIVASLNGYALYLSRIPSQNLEAVLDENHTIISSPQFWKLQKHKSRNVRAAFFSLLTSFLQNAPSLVEDEHKRLTNSILATIDDYDPVVLPTVWESVLHLVTVVPDCWQHVNLEKLVLNKLCSIIGHGGQGSAHFIFPNILLLLSKIPGDIIKNKVQFYSKIFSSFLQGMKQPSVTQSQSESDAITSSFNECVRYIIMSNLENDELCCAIIRDHVLTCYSNLMLDPVSRHLIAPFYSAFVQNLVYWERNCASNPAYESHLGSICESLPSLNIRNLNKSCEDRARIAFIHECQVKFVTVLNHPSVKKKKRLRVQFSLDEDSHTPSKAPEAPPPEEVDFHEEALRTKLYPLIDELIKKYFTVACNHESAEVKSMNVDQLWRLTSALNSEQLSKLSHTYAKDLYPALSNWLRCEYIPVNCILGLIFNTIENVDEVEKSSMLAQLTEVRPDESVLEVIKMASQEMSGKKTFKTWLESEKVRSEIIKTLNDRIESGGNCVHFLEMCWSTYKSGEPVLGTETVSTLLDVVLNNLESGKISHLLISQLFESLLVERNHYIVSNCGPKILCLLKSLFVLILTNSEPEIVSSWKKGLKFVFSLSWESDALLMGYTNECINIVAELLNTWEALSISNVIRSVEFMYFMTVTSLEHGAMKTEEDSVLWSSKFFSCVMNSNWEAQYSLIEELVSCGEIVKGNIMATEFSPNTMIITKGHWDPLEGINLLTFARSLLFCTKYMMMTVGALILEEFESSEYDPLKDNIARNLTNIEYLVKLSHGLLLCKNSLNHFSSTKQTVGLKDYTNNIESDLKELVQRLRPEEQGNLIELCQNRSKEKGGHSTWKYTVELIQNNFLELEPKVDETPLSGEITISIDFLYTLRTRRTDSDHVRKVLAVIVDTYKGSEYSAFNRDLASMTPEQLCLNVEIGRFLKLVLEKHKDVIAEVERGWDFIMITIASWFISISISKSVHHYSQFVQFVVSLCELLVSFVGHFLKDEEASKSVLYEEWTKLFASETYLILRQSWCALAESTVQDNLKPISLLHMDLMGQAICQLCEWNIPGATFVTLENINEFMNTSMKTIMSPHIPVQITSYLMLTNAVPQLVKKDENHDENNLNKLSCQSCLPSFNMAQNVVTALLQDFSLGVSCAVSPHTDGYTYTLAYLMLWCWLLEMCRSCESQLRYVYTLWIKERNLIPHIIESIFKLMPESVLHLGETNIKKKQELFMSRPVSSLDTWSSEKLSHFSCWLYCELLRILPAVARQWTAEADPKFLSFVDKLTSTYVSPILCHEEMMAIKDEQKAFDNVQVQTHSAVREVIAVYTVEETSTELIIKLAANHPLSPPKVEISKAIKISSNQNRQLLMQLTIFLTHQNGSIWDGLLLWKSNLDKKFEGVEECYICFSIVHQSSHQLPKMTCGTCKKKFHSFCLYKWFTTSNMSTCPICRNHF